MKEMTIRRNSSVEVLRLIVMLFILLNHFMFHGLNLINYETIDTSNYPSIIATFMAPFFSCAVNVFVLISGFYGIKPKLGNFFKIYLQCFFYGLIFYLIHLFVDNQALGKSILNNSLFVLSNDNGWWFIKDYIILFLLSPLLNKAIETFSSKQAIICLIFLSIINLYFGFLWGNEINDDGFNVMQFVYLYVIGRIIGHNVPLERIGKIRHFYGFAYIFLSVILGLIGLFNALYIHSGNPFLNVAIYNHPFLILSSLSLLLFMVTQSYYSKTLNWFSSSTLSIYLITENAYFSPYVYSTIPLVWGLSNTLILKFSILLGYAFVVMLLCLLFDKVRLLLMKPLYKYLFPRLDLISSKFL